MKNRKAALAAGLCAALVLAGCGETQNNNENVSEGEKIVSETGVDTDTSAEPVETEEQSGEEGAEAEEIVSLGEFPASEEWNGADLKAGPLQIADVFMNYDMTLGEVAGRVYESAAKDRFIWGFKKNDVQCSADEFMSATGNEYNDMYPNLIYMNEDGVPTVTIKFVISSDDLKEYDDKDMWHFQNIYIQQNEGANEEDYLKSLRCMDGRSFADIMLMDLEEVQCLKETILTEAFPKGGIADSENNITFICYDLGTVLRDIEYKFYYTQDSDAIYKFTYLESPYDK